MTREIKLNVIYKARESFILFPSHVIILNKLEHDKDGLDERYRYFDIQKGQEQDYLTRMDIELVYEKYE